MCYSERLDKAAGYQTENGYVLLGYKVVVKFGPLLMPWTPFYEMMEDSMSLTSGEAMRWGSDGGVSGAKPESPWVRDHATMGYYIHPRLMEKFGDKMAKWMNKPTMEHAWFPPRELMVVGPDRHGFHVAASEYNALHERSANPFGIGYEDRVVCADETQPRDLIYPYVTHATRNFQIERQEKPNAPGVLVRVLVPEYAVTDDNHALAMMVIPPGEKETDADVEACDQHNARLKPRTPEDYQQTRDELDAVLAEANAKVE